MNVAKIVASQYRCKKQAAIRQEEKKRRFRDVLNLIRFSNRSGNHINCIRFSLGEGRNHIYAKIKLCLSLMENKHKFITEAIFLNGARCDVLDLTEGVVYEILCSETEKQLQNKIKNYPCELEVICIKH